MGQELTIEESVKVLEEWCQLLFRSQPSGHLSQAITAIQNARLHLKQHQHPLQDLENYGVDTGSTEPHPIPIPVGTYCTECDAESLGRLLSQTSPHRYGISLGSHLITIRGKRIGVFLDGVEQPDCDECLAGVDGWVRLCRFNSICPTCGGWGLLIEITTGQVEARLVAIPTPEPILP